jgi:hypothetical protein
MMRIYNKLVDAHSRDITCPWCGAEPQQPCHVIGNPERVLPGVHVKRNEHLRALWHNGYSVGHSVAYRNARDNAAEAAS